MLKKLWRYVSVGECVQVVEGTVVRCERSVDGCRGCHFDVAGGCRYLRECTHVARRDLESVIFRLVTGPEEILSKDVLQARRLSQGEMMFSSLLWSKEWREQTCKDCRFYYCCRYLQELERDELRRSEEWAEHDSVFVSAEMADAVIVYRERAALNDSVAEPGRCRVREMYEGASLDVFDIRMSVSPRGSTEEISVVTLGVHVGKLDKASGCDVGMSLGAVLAELVRPKPMASALIADWAVSDFIQGLFVGIATTMPRSVGSGDRGLEIEKLE